MANKAQVKAAPRQSDRLGDEGLKPTKPRSRPRLLYRASVGTAAQSPNSVSAITWTVVATSVQGGSPASVTGRQIPRHHGQFTPSRDGPSDGFDPLSTHSTQNRHPRVCINRCVASAIALTSSSLLPPRMRDAAAASLSTNQTMSRPHIMSRSFHAAANTAMASAAKICCDRGIHVSTVCWDNSNVEARISPVWLPIKTHPRRGGNPDSGS